MKKIRTVCCALACLYGCLDNGGYQRPSPSDRGVEVTFDARPPVVTPNSGSGSGSGSGYGSGSSGPGAAASEMDQGIVHDLRDVEMHDLELDSNN